MVDAANKHFSYASHIFGNGLEVTPQDGAIRWNYDTSDFSTSQGQVMEEVFTALDDLISVDFERDTSVGAFPSEDGIYVDEDPLMTEFTAAWFDSTNRIEFRDTSYFDKGTFNHEVGHAMALDHPGSVSGNTNDWNNHWGNGMFAWPTLDGPDGDWLLDEQDTAMMWGADAPREEFNWMDEQALWWQYGFETDDAQHIWDVGGTMWGVDDGEKLTIQEMSGGILALPGEAEEFLFNQSTSTGTYADDTLAMYDDECTALSVHAVTSPFYLKFDDTNDGAASSNPTYGYYEVVRNMDTVTLEIGGEKGGRG